MKTKPEKVKTPLKSSNRLGKAKIDIESKTLMVFYEAPKGLTDVQLAEFLGLGISTYYTIKQKNKAFREAINHYRRISPIEVLESFKKLAMGFTAKETTKELRKNPKTKEMEMVVTQEHTKHFPPNASAGIFYLKNRMPEHFKDKIENEHTFNNAFDSVTVIIKGREGNT